MRARDPLSVPDTRRCLRFDRKRLILVIKLSFRSTAPCHPPDPPPLSGRGGAALPYLRQSLQSPPGDTARGSPGPRPSQTSRGCCPGVGSLGRGSPSSAFGNPRDAPATYLRPSGVAAAGTRRQPTPASSLKTSAGLVGTGAAGRSERGRAERGGAGRGGAGRGGRGRGLRAPGSQPALPAGLHTVCGSAQPVRSSQVRMRRVGRGGPGTAGLRAGEGQELARGARRLSQAQRPTLLG